MLTSWFTHTKNLTCMCTPPSACRHTAEGDFAQKETCMECILEGDGRRDRIFKLRTSPSGTPLGLQSSGAHSDEAEARTMNLSTF